MSQQPIDDHPLKKHHVEPLVRNLRRGRSTHLETIIQFLERDVYTDGSGYFKDKIWRYLPRVTLTEAHKERLRAVALQYVRIRRSREFFPMCRFIRGIATEEFEQRVRELEGSPDAPTRHRAGLLAAYLRSVEEGGAARRASSERWQGR